MKHKKYVLQQGEKDCAVSCLYNIIRYYDGSISINKLRNLLNTDESGTSIYDIVKISNQLGLKAEAYECELNDLCDLKFPIIAHLKIQDKYDHFVILDKLIDDEIIIFDPIRGYIKYSLEEFYKEWSNVIITFKKTNEIVKEKEDNFINYILFSDLFNIVNTFKTVLLILLISIISSIISVFHSVYLSILYNSYIPFLKVFTIFIFICILKFIMDYLRNIIILKYTKDFDYKITSETYNKILSLPIIFHHNRPVGDIFSRINDLSSIKEFINTISFSFIIDVIYILLISIILFAINKIMFMLLFIMICIYMLIYIIYRKNINNISPSVKESISDSNSYLVESLLGIDTIKNLNIEKNIYDMFKQKYNKYLNINYKFNKLIVNFDLIQLFISNISCILVVSIGFIFYKNNNISLSNIISFNSLIVYLFISLKNIISLDELIIESKNSYKRLNNLFKESEENNKKNQNLNEVKKISIKNLNYSYNKINNIISNINFTINKNDKVFIKGKSGSGKSTIFKLIVGYLKCDDKMIKINNIDINNINKNDIVNNICFVSQNEYIFTDTILNNIKLFEEAKKEEIEKVVKVTGIDKVLERRNITLDFLLEENGHNLSGGERQRIILARSLLRNKQVLILDETLNELDTISERNIIKEIIKNYNITLILISHRFDNSDLFNKIIEIGGNNEETNKQSNETN